MGTKTTALLALLMVSFFASSVASVVYLIKYKTELSVYRGTFPMKLKQDDIEIKQLVEHKKEPMISFDPTKHLRIDLGDYYDNNKPVVPNKGFVPMRELKFNQVVEGGLHLASLSANGSVPTQLNKQKTNNPLQKPRKYQTMNQAKIPQNERKDHFSPLNRYGSSEFGNSVAINNQGNNAIYGNNGTTLDFRMFMRPTITSDNNMGSTKKHSQKKSYDFDYLEKQYPVSYWNDTSIGAYDRATKQYYHRFNPSCTV